MGREVSESCVDSLLTEMVSSYCDRFYANKPELAARRIEAIGFQVGHQLSERYTMERPRFSDNLEAIKFICKDFWSELFKKQIDNLKTNHKGTFVLQDNRFRWLARMSIDPSSEDGDLSQDNSAPVTENKATQATSMHLYFPCGIIRGALSNLGIPCAVSADISSLPALTSILHSRERPEYLPPENAANSSFADLQLTATTYKNFQLLLNEQWNSPDEMCDAIFHSLQMSLDPAKLVLDVIQGSFPRIWEKRETGFQASSMNGYFFMLEQLMRMSPQIDPQVKEEAIKLAVDWKERLIVNTRNSLEVLAFLQLLASYGLASSFDGYEILKLFEVVTQYKQAVELCQTLGFADEIPDFIEKLIERKLYIKAVRFVCAFKLVDNFPPVLLLKEYLENARRSAQKLCQKKKSFQAKDEATDGEIDALRTAMECIIDFNLESEFPPKDIEKRIVELEKLRAERRSSVPGPKKQVWHQNKNKRLRTEVSTVEPFDIPVFTPSGQYETSYLYSGGPRQFASSGNSSRNNLRTRQGFAGNHYLYHS